MKSRIYKEIIADYLEFKLPELITRENDIPLELKIKRARAIIGPRRTGKTYFIYSAY